MHLNKILILVAIGLLCTNARVLKKRIRKRIRSCGGCPSFSPEPTYGCFGTCNCQNIFLDETPNYCGCQYVDTYGVISPELPNNCRMSAVRLPKVPVLPIGCDLGTPVCSYEVLPAINLPGFCEPLSMPCLNELLCPCQVPTAVRYIETPSLGYQNIPCGCQNMRCGCQNMPYGCQNIPCDCQNIPCSCQNTQCGCQNTLCGCKNIPLGCQNVPCGCQNIPCGCQNMPCGCQNMPCGCQNIPCCCQDTPCTCKCQNIIQYSQLPALELPCACQACQLSPVELPVFSYGCHSLPPPVIGCGGKYLRQVTIQPPFL